MYQFVSKVTNNLGLTMSCCKIETATIAFATILAILSAIVACVGLTGLLYLVGCILFDIFTSDYYPLFGVVSVILNFSTISFLFCILLIRGVKQRNMKLLRAYFIYGSLVTILAVIGTVADLTWFYGQDPEIILAMVSIVLYHTIMLVLTMTTYLKFHKEILLRSSDRLHLMNNQQLFVGLRANILG